MKRRRSERGYTLLETLIAFAILSLALSVLLPSLSTMIAQSSAREKTWIAGELALSLEAENLVTREAQPGAKSGSWGQFDWLISTTSHRLGAPGQAGVSRHYLVRITVTDRDTGAELIERESIRARALDP